MALFDKYRADPFVLFPPRGPFARLLTKILLYLFLYGTAFFLLPHSLVTPGGTLFSLFVLYTLTEVFGVIAKQLMFLPSLVGMIVAGIFVSNIQFFQYHVDNHVSSSLRNVAFIALLARAGLELDTEALMKMKRVCLLMSFVPGVMAESPVVAVLSWWILGLPWGWAFMIGFIMAAVSPAIVVACIIKIQQKGYGTAKGIPTLVIASSSVDDIVAICCFSVAMTVTFATGSVVWVACKAPIEFIAGAVPGALIGVIFWYLPAEGDRHKTFLRYAMLFIGGMTAFFGAELAHSHGAGPLFVITVAFTASRKWGHDTHAVEKAFGITWRYLAPLLFGLIGAELKLDLLDISVLGIALVIVVFGVLARLVAAFVCCMGVGLNFKEKLFVSISSIPKATVQAAIGSVPLDVVRQLKDDPEYENVYQSYESWALKILAIAVVSVILTAPLGAVLTTVTGPLLLEKDSITAPETALNGDIETNSKSKTKSAESVAELQGEIVMKNFDPEDHTEI